MSDTKKLAQSWIFNWFFGFNQVPTNEDSLIYMQSVLCCAKADGVLSPKERDWAIGFCASWGVADWVIEELKAYQADEDLQEVIARSPQVSMAQRDLLLTAIRACAADGPPGRFWDAHWVFEYLLGLLYQCGTWLDENTSSRPEVEPHSLDQLNACLHPRATERCRKSLSPARRLCQGTPEAG